METGKGLATNADKTVYMQVSASVDSRRMELLKIRDISVKGFPQIKYLVELVGHKGGNSSVISERNQKSSRAYLANMMLLKSVILA